MFDSLHTQPKLVFLHIPKTAGQTIHNELVRAFGNDQVSPVRVHTQARNSADQFPSGYRFFSGHVDWTDLNLVPKPRFVFSVLRDPKERIASFYFYLRKEAQRLSADALALPQNAGKRAALSMTADDYFFGGGLVWQSFIKDHYDNFYCRYFGSRKVRAGESFSNLPDRRKLRWASRNLAEIDWVYSVESIDLLEEDLNALFGLSVSFRGKFDNLGDRPRTESRWPRLMDCFETDAARRKIEDYVALDLALMDRMEL